MRVRSYVPAVAFAILAGCGHSSGFLRDASTAGEAQLRMEIAAQRYARSVSGSSSIGSVFCLIPLGNGAYRDAMAALHAQAKLQTNEVLQNIREDHAFVPYVLYCEDNLIVSADVYEVIAAAPPGEARGGRGGDCDPPYSIDSQGRKLFRTECLSSEKLEPSDPYIPPSSPNAPPTTRLGDAGAPRDPGLCERAFARLDVDVRDPFRSIFPNARFVDAPPRAAFVDACAEQGDDVQLCLQPSFLKLHLEACRAEFRQMNPDQRSRLFGTFLREW
jgi:hypothetical protein